MALKKRRHLRPTTTNSANASESEWHYFKHKTPKIASVQNFPGCLQENPLAKRCHPLGIRMRSI